MKLLWVKAGKLLPLDTGGKIRSYKILAELARIHSVKLLTYYGGSRDLEYERNLESEFPGACTIYTAALDGTGFRQSLDYLIRFLNPAPFAVSKFTHDDVTRTLLSLLGSRQFDVCVCDFLSASLNFTREVATPTVLFQHNVETVLWQRMAAAESNLAKRMVYRIEAAKMARYEPAALAKFQHVVAVSERDREQMIAMNPASRISVVPTGVDTQKFTAAPPASADPPRIVFSGSMDWEPNVDAAVYFCRRILPKIRQELPNAIFQIVGRNPHRSLQRLATDFVQITGTVPSVTDYLRDATVVVVPLRMGGGTRLKILEAMAMGKAVVSTTVGAEGLELRNGNELMLADDAAAFASAVVLLVQNNELRRQYELTAVRAAAQRNWSKVASQFAQALQEAMGTGIHRAPTSAMAGRNDCFGA